MRRPSYLGQRDICPSIYMNVVPQQPHLQASHEANRLGARGIVPPCNARRQFLCTTKLKWWPATATNRSKHDALRHTKLPADACMHATLQTHLADGSTTPCTAAYGIPLEGVHMDYRTRTALIVQHALFGTGRGRPTAIQPSTRRRHLSSLEANASLRGQNGCRVSRL